MQQQLELQTAFMLAMRIQLPPPPPPPAEITFIIPMEEEIECVDIEEDNTYEDPDAVKPKKVKKVISANKVATIQSTQAGKVLSISKMAYGSVIPPGNHL